MGKTYIFGDLHSDSNNELQFLSTKKWPEQKELTKEDVLIQLGDFGLPFSYPKFQSEYKKEINILNKLSDKNFTILVIPGNHENYDMIEEMPIINKWGGRVYENKLKYGSIYYALRGEIYLINGKTLFAFGGALSSDKDDRFELKDLGETKYVDKQRYGQSIGKRLKKITISMISYWKQELFTEDEKENALTNLEKVNFKVDYIITHTCPNYLLPSFLKRDLYNSDKFECPTSYFLEEISKKVSFYHWYFGHLHKNKNLGKYTCHYKNIPIELIK